MLQGIYKPNYVANMWNTNASQVLASLAGENVKYVFVSKHEFNPRLIAITTQLEYCLPLRIICVRVENIASMFSTVSNFIENGERNDAGWLY